jgi:hypothetical protein
MRCQRWAVAFDCQNLVGEMREGEYAGEERFVMM